MKILLLIPFALVLSKNTAAQVFIPYKNQIIDLSDTIATKELITKEKNRYPVQKHSVIFNQIGHKINLEYNDNNKFFHSLFYFRLAYKSSLETNNIEGKAYALINMAAMEWNIGNNDIAREMYHDAISCSKNINENSRADIMLLYARHLSISQQYDSSLIYFHQALHYYEQMNDTAKIAQIYSDIGLTYTEMGLSDKSREYLVKSALITKNDISNYEIYSTSLLNLSKHYSSIEQNDTAIYLAKASLNAFEKIGDHLSMGFCLNNIGVYYYKKSNKKLAVYYINESRIVKEKFGEKRSLISTYQNLSQIYSELGYKDSSNIYLDKLEELSSYIDESRTSMYLTKYQKLKNEKDYKNALYNLEEYWKIVEKIKQHTFNEQVLKSSEALRLSLKENEIKELENIRIKQAYENQGLKSQNLMLLIFGLFVIIITILIFIIYVHKQKNDKIKKQFESMIRENRSRMNPHFIFNALHSIRYYISENAGNLAEDFLIRFADLMRNVLMQSGQDTISLAEEIKTLELYLSLEKERLENRFDYTIIIDENIDPKQTLFPSLCIQPFTENAIKHAFGNSNKQGLLTVCITKQEHRLKVSINDNGPGMDATTIKSTSQGMKLTRDRIENYAALHKIDASFLVSSSKEGTKIEFFVKHKSFF